MTIVAGGIIKHDNKILLVQEKEGISKGKWCLPIGHIDNNEYIEDTAIREIKEETGIDVELDGLVIICNVQMLHKNDKLISIIFNTKCNDIIEGYQSDEIIQTKLFTIDEIINMKDNIRRYDLIIEAINRTFDNNIIPIDLIKIDK